jgi:Ca-activated chloride channel family protein
VIHVAWPWMALLLPLPWLHYRLRRAAAPCGTALYLPFLAGLLGDAPRVASVTGRGGRTLFAAIWLLAVLAAVRPQWLGDPLPVPTTGRSVMLAVDVSGSMATRDMGDSDTRLQVVQRVAGDFIDGRRGDRVGLILFGSQPYLQAPISADLSTIHQFLDEAVVGIAGTQTAIGDAIGLAIKRTRARLGSSDRSRSGNKTVLILLTDGQSNAGAMDPLEAARLAARVGLRIYTIGVGAVAHVGFFGVSGNRELDEGTLRRIAEITGGKYFRAADAKTLQRVYAEIDRLEPTPGRDQWLRPATEWFVWPLGLALLLSVPAVWLGARTWT